MIPPEALGQLKSFLTIVKNTPQILHTPDLAFFKEFIESFGGVVPKSAPNEVPKPTQSKETKSEPADIDLDPEEESELEESDVELDQTGVIENPDVMEDEDIEIDLDVEISEENLDKANEKKMEAIGLIGEGNFDKAIEVFTEAIRLNPNMSLLHVKRGQCYLQLQKPNACIRDCTRALTINPDNAAAYKFRGRAHRLLGNWLNAVQDLRNACHIDFDEQANEWLKEVNPNAKKLEEHQRKYERKRAEQEMKERQKRINKAREEHAKASTNAKSDFDGAFGDFKIPPDYMDMFKDQDFSKDFKDPDVSAFFNEFNKNPSVETFKKYMNNPKIQKLISKAGSKIDPSMFRGGFPGFGGGSNPPPPPPPSTGTNVNDDIGLD